MTAVPLFVLPLAHLASDEKLALRKTLGVILGFIGAAVLLGPGALRLGQGIVPLAQVACLGAALSYAVASVLTRRCPPVDSIAMAAITLAVGAVCLVPAAALLRVTVVRSAGSVFMTLVNYQVPVWSMVFGALVLNEALPGRFFAALVLILAGLAISQWHGLGRRFAPRG
jgi:drug/metabolite transporter (DMT)-like permease